MSADYYVRSRGRVRGPFSSNALRKQLRAGIVSRFDQISTDRKNWQAVHYFPELDDAPPAASMPSPQQPVSAESVASAPQSTPSGAVPERVESVQQVEHSTAPKANESAPIRHLSRALPISAGLLIGFAVNLPKSATQERLLFWWDQDWVQLAVGAAITLIALICILLPWIARNQSEAWLAGVGLAVLSTLTIGVVAVQDVAQMIGRWDWNVTSVPARLAYLQAAVFITLLITSILLMVIAGAVAMRSSAPNSPQGTVNHG
jgi:hypothetical protein